MAEKKKGKKTKTKKEKVCEVFEVKKDGKEKVVEACGTAETPITNKGQIEHQKKLLRNILIVMGIFIGGVILILMAFYSMSHFETGGVKYEILKEGTVQFYHTSFPSNFVTPSRTVEYNVYLRNDPREIKDISFEGGLSLLEMAVLDSKENFDCEGDGVIAVANFNQIMGALGTQVVRDEEYSQCDQAGRYMFLELKSGEENKIVKTGPACYDLFIKDCEVIKVTERFLIESPLI